MDEYTVGHPSLDDAKEIHDLVSTYDTSVVGEPDMTFEDVADELGAPGFDRERNGWLVRDASGQLAAYAGIRSKGRTSDLFLIELTVRPGAAADVTELIWSKVLARAEEMRIEMEFSRATLDIGVYRVDEARQAVAKSYGFAPATSFHRLRVDFDGLVSAPEPPAGVTVRAATSDDVRRDAHLIHEEGFADHFGFVPVSYDNWFENRDAFHGTDWSQALVAYVDGTPAAVAVSDNSFLPDQNCGYVATLAVRPAFRGRGLGRLMLTTAIAADAANGRGGTILHVDSNNVTPALALYTSVGMRTVMVIDAWQREI